MTITRRGFLKAAGTGVVAGVVASPLVDYLFTGVREAFGQEPLKDPNVRQAEILWLFLVPDGARGYKYDPEHRHVVFDGRALPVDKPWWSPTPWSQLRPGDVLRIREPDGALELAGDHAVCLVTDYPEQIEGVWGVKVEPLNSIDVVFKAGGQHCVRGYSCGKRA